MASFLRAQGTDVWVEPVSDSDVIEVNMDDLEESDVWSALLPAVKGEPADDAEAGDMDARMEADIEADFEADFEADIEADIEAEVEEQEGGDSDSDGSPTLLAAGPGMTPQELAEVVQRRVGRRRSYKCRVCGKHMGAMSALQRHIMTHTDEERMAQPFARQCEQCGRVLSSRQRLESHMLSAHAVGEKKASQYVRRSLGCPVCGKVLSSSQRVRSHMATHMHKPIRLQTPTARPLRPAPDLPHHPALGAHHPTTVFIAKIVEAAEVAGFNQQSDLS